MANLRKWSSSASGNSSVAGGANTINFAEGQTPGSVNNSAREMMAQVRSIYTPAEWGWVEHSATASVASQTSFKISGDQTTNWTAGRRWRLKSGSTTRYGSVVSSSYTAETTITVTVDSGSLSASHSLAALSAIDGSSNQLPGAQQSFLRNRIINGDMRIDQRNAGASIANIAGGTYSVDRWSIYGPIATKFTAQQNAGAVAPPAGHKNYLGITSSSAYTVGATEGYAVRQYIEGFNTSDLGFGAAGASSVTLSFWVRSSLTGNFGGCFYNGASDRFYPFTYSISAANTWEQKTVTIAGDTSGTWIGATNGIGLGVQFSLGAGATASGTAGAWTSSAVVQPTGSVSVVGTNAATWYVTGVQLEAGSAATPFERRQYGQELALCQRYFYKVASIPLGFAIDAARPSALVTHKVTMRTAPTAANGTFVASAGGPGTVSLSGGNTTEASKFFNSGTAWTAGADITISVDLSAEL